MAAIILDGRRIKAFEALQTIGGSAGKDKAYLDALWEVLSLDQQLFSEFVYYLENRCFFDGIRQNGYGLTDLYFYLMRRYEVSHDVGKNLSDCDKESLVLDSFQMMAEMKKDPAPDFYKRSGIIFSYLFVEKRC
ncbi:MAG: hypothetical protein K5739_00855 [Lachnospiraceae bacterium]|nr:hypothetical protein [Lachnospiraceae bacterium]